MTTEQNNDGKVDVTVTFHNLPSALRGDTSVRVDRQRELSSTLSKTLSCQQLGRIKRDGKFVPICAAPVIEVKDEGDNEQRVGALIDQWLAALTGAPLTPPEMSLTPEMVSQVMAATGVDVSQSVITDIQCVAPHMFNITLGERK